MNLKLEQLDIKTAFLHGDLDEEIFIEQLEDFKVKGNENMALRQCYKKFDFFMMSQEYKRTFADPCVYVRRFFNDKKVGKLWLSQERYIEQTLQKYNMKYVKPISTPLAGHFKLIKKSCPSIEKEKDEMPIIHIRQQLEV
ncbi:hypothetical protein AAG906_021519 [Vitis piasezkii]